MKYSKALLLFLLPLCGCGPSPKDGGIPPVTVCDLCANPEKYNNQEIEVPGRIIVEFENKFDMFAGANKACLFFGIPPCDPSDMDFSAVYDHASKLFPAKTKRRDVADALGKLQEKFEQTGTNKVIINNTPTMLILRFPVQYADFTDEYVMHFDFSDTGELTSLHHLTQSYNGPPYDGKNKEDNPPPPPPQSAATTAQPAPPSSPAKPLVVMGDVFEMPSTPRIGPPLPPPALRTNLAISDQLISNDTRSTIVSLPPALVGAEWMQMSSYPWNFYVTFKLTAEADAYFAFSKNPKLNPLPSHWIATGEQIKTAIHNYDLYRVPLPANKNIVLYGGLQDDDDSPPYPDAVIFKPRPTTARPASASTSAPDGYAK